MQETIGISVSRASASCDCGALADAEADARWALERAEGVRRMHAVSEVIRVLIERDALEAAEELSGQGGYLFESGWVAPRSFYGR